MKTKPYKLLRDKMSPKARAAADKKAKAILAEMDAKAAKRGVKYYRARCKEFEQKYGITFEAFKKKFESSKIERVSDWEDLIVWEGFELELKKHDKSIESRLEAMEMAGLLTRAKGKLKPIKPVARTKGKRTVADILIKDRG
jgi:hypothetical protein